MKDITPHGAAATMIAGFAKISGISNTYVSKKYAATGCIISFTNTIRREREAITSSLLTLKITPSAKSRTGEAVEEIFEHLELSQVRSSHKSNLLAFPKLVDY